MDLLELKGVYLPIVEGITDGAIATSIRKGEYEKHEYINSLNIAKDGDRVLDIGSGLGFVSTSVAKTFHLESLTCYDANPKLVDYLGKVHEINSVSLIVITMY